jgi:hypothetical protein
VNEVNEQLLRKHLYTQTKLRGVGIDIRSDGGYIVCSLKSDFSCIKIPQRNTVIHHNLRDPGTIELKNSVTEG